MEAELREREERFRQLAENIREVVWMSDPEKEELIYVNPAYEEIWGESTDSLYDDPTAFLEAVHPEIESGSRLPSRDRPVGDTTRSIGSSAPMESSAGSATARFPSRTMRGKCSESSASLRTSPTARSANGSTR
jgi:PAS domain S-box-containing protein